MIQSDKGWNIKLGSWIFLGNLALWSSQAIVQIIRNGALSAPVIQSVGFAFFVFGTAFGTFTDEGNRIRCMEWYCPRCFPCRLSPG